MKEIYTIASTQTNSTVESSTTTHETVSVSMVFYLITAIFYTLMILAYVLNILLIICISFSKAFSPINLLILNLAVSDILYASGIPVFSIQIYSPYYKYSESLCRFSFLIDKLSLSVHVGTITALTLERYFCIKETCNPSNEKLKIFIIILCIILLWILGFFFMLPHILAITVDTYHQCFSQWSYEMEKNFFWIQFFIFFAIPYTLIIIFSIKILIFLRRWAQNANKFRPTFTELTIISSTIELSRIDKEESKMVVEKKKSSTQVVPATRATIIRNRITKFVIAIVILFLVVWSPLWAFQAYNMLWAVPDNHIAIVNIAILMVNYTGCVINPLFFILLTHNFRDYFTKLTNRIQIFSRRQKIKKEIELNARQSSNKTNKNCNNNKNKLLKATYQAETVSMLSDKSSCKITEMKQIEFID